jgi:hypothetical protein
MGGLHQSGSNPVHVPEARCGGQPLGLVRNHPHRESMTGEEQVVFDLKCSASLCLTELCPR